MRSAAEQTECVAMLNFAAYAQAHALTAVGALTKAMSLVTAGVSGSSGSDPKTLAAHGSCLLVSAATSSALGEPDIARAQIDEAAKLAERINRPNMIAQHTSFSSWNVTMHRVSVEVESGDPVAAVAAARPLIDNPVRALSCVTASAACSIGVIATLEARSCEVWLNDVEFSARTECDVA